jgi:hypothetical protein
MKKNLTLSLALSILLFSFSAFAEGVIGIQNAPPTNSQASENITSVGPNTIVRTTSFQGSDSLATGDPLGNNPVTVKDDQGPPLTQQLSYDSTCQNEACSRAFHRWNSSTTTWQHDRATGLSLGWGS